MNGFREEKRRFLCIPAPTFHVLQKTDHRHEYRLSFSNSTPISTLSKTTNKPCVRWRFALQALDMGELTNKKLLVQHKENNRLGHKREYRSNSLIHVDLYRAISLFVCLRYIAPHDTVAHAIVSANVLNHLWSQRQRENHHQHYIHSLWLSGKEAL